MRAASSAGGGGRGGSQAGGGPAGRAGGPNSAGNSNFHSRKSSNASSSSQPQSHASNTGAAAAGGSAAPGSGAASSGSGAAGPSNSSNVNASSHSNAPVSPLALSELLGAQLRLTLNTGSRDKERPVVNGALWCYDPAYGSLVLSTPGSAAAGGGSNSYRIVRLSSIQSVQVTSDPAKDTVEVETKAINPDRIREREQQGVAAEQKRLASLPPPGVSELGKELFEALRKTMPVRWADTTMFVFNCSSCILRVLADCDICQQRGYGRSAGRSTLRPKQAKWGTEQRCPAEGKSDKSPPRGTQQARA